MTDITIPLKAVGAAAVNVAALLDWHDWSSMDEADRALCRRIAIAALRAGIAAWPGAEWRESGHYPNGIGGPDATVMKRIILPLLTETTNAEG